MVPFAGINPSVWSDEQPVFVGMSYLSSAVG